MKPAPRHWRHPWVPSWLDFLHCLILFQTDIVFPFWSLQHLRVSSETQASLLTLYTLASRPCLRESSSATQYLATLSSFRNLGVSLSHSITNSFYMPAKLAPPPHLPSILSPHIPSPFLLFLFRKGQGRSHFCSTFRGCLFISVPVGGVSVWQAHIADLITAAVERSSLYPSRPSPKESPNRPISKVL